LESFADRIARTYSGGQRRRLDLALGMVHRPRLLFLDEPTTGLDPQSRVRLWEEDRKLQEEGTTIFLTTHYLEEADALADRLAIIDERGRYIGEEYTLALCLDYILSQRQGVVVTNCATSRMCQDIAERHGSRLVRSPVGEANVCDRMLAENAVFGGEGSGGPIDPRVGYVRDSFVGMALVLAGLAERGGTLSQWVDSLPCYAIEKTKFTLEAARVAPLWDALERKFPEAQASRDDGLRLDWPDQRAWLLVRGSNTEPIVRAIAEAPTAEAAKKLCEAVAGLIA